MSKNNYKTKTGFIIIFCPSQVKWSWPKSTIKPVGKHLLQQFLSKHISDNSVSLTYL